MDAIFRSLETGIGLDIVVWFQAHSSAAADALAVALYRVGGYPLYLLIFAVLYWLVDKRLAKRFLIALILSGLLIASFKLALERPRPVDVAPDRVYALTVEHTYGFPSGHVGITLPVLGVLAAEVRKRWAWWLLAAYIALMAWSRMAAGVHYPQDVIGGTLIGLVVLGWTLGKSTGAAILWNSLPMLVRGAGMALASSLITAFLWRDVLDVILAGVILGAGTGFIVDEQYIHYLPHGTLAQRIMRALLGVAFVGLIAFLVLTVESQLRYPTVFQMAGYALVSFGAVAVYPYVLVRAGLARGSAA